MRLTSFTDYSLRVLIHLAADPGRRATIAEIAAAFDVSEHHLTKVVHFLARAGWLTTVRGNGGGLGLAHAPADIVVGEVVRQTEGAALPAECFEADGGHCCIAPICRLRSLLRESVDAFYAVLDGATLADLVRNGPALANVLRFDRSAARRPGTAP
jgi:Rrf2 family nitric oxide-sensitive transcriptional repressor